MPGDGMKKPTYSHLQPGSKDDDVLINLALNLRDSRYHDTDKIWESLDADQWEATQNPLLILQTVSQEKIDVVMARADIQEIVKLAVARDSDTASGECWFTKNFPNSNLKTAAYFSMEFMLNETLPIYSGGLGNVAGDQLKSADDLGVPVVAVGLLYAQGYFRQEVDADGNQIALYPINDPGHLPVKPLRLPDGQWLRLQIDVPGSKLWIQTWEVQIGKTKLYLLDTNDPANLASHRCITSELYGGGPELRLKQEMVLGIGGWRLLRALGIEPQVCHLNEGHAGFAVLERARSFMEDNEVDFQTALAVTRAGNVFTTHTAVEAGFDRFPPTLVKTYLTEYAQLELGVSIVSLLALGRQNAADDEEPFTMAFLAVHSSGAVNGVSELHGVVSREIFQSLFPRWPQAEVPVSYVTNGVHMPTWLSQSSADLWAETCGNECWSNKVVARANQIRSLSDAEIWKLRTDARKQLIDVTRRRYGRQVAESGWATREVAAAFRIFDANVLTLGFARRFATYKRPNLLLHDPDRLQRLLNNRERPVQLILAGKAHPQDRAGQAMIKEWIDYIKQPDVKGNVVFLSDYDMHLTKQLVPGIDVWVNTPRRPWEASGTSGMKVLGNGGLNLSELDGWWAEAYSDDVGWAIGDRQEHGDDPGVDAAEAETLYRLLEEHIVPEFYERNSEGIPLRWTSRIRESMARLAPTYSAGRTVAEYTEKFYVPAADAYVSRAANHGKVGFDILNWQERIVSQWSRIRFGNVSVETNGDTLAVSVHLYLNTVSPEDIRVELYSDEGAPGHVEMIRRQELVGSDGGYLYTADLPKDRSADNYTPRVLPYFKGASVPLELPNILWQR
jgi:starch phosphorylase